MAFLVAGFWPAKMTPGPKRIRRAAVLTGATNDAISEVSNPQTAATELASACWTTNALFNINRDWGATVEEARCSQFGVMTGASNGSSIPNGLERRTCT